MDYSIKTLEQLRPVLRGFRRARGLTQAGLARQLGITQQSYAELEANPASASLGRLLPVLRLLGVELLFREQGGVPQAPAPAETPAVSAPPARSKAGKRPYLTIHKTSGEGW